MHYTISKEQIEQVAYALTKTYRHAAKNGMLEGFPDIETPKDMLAGLLAQPEQEPVVISKIKIPTNTMEQQFAYYEQRGYAKGIAASKPFTPITAEMVTDEMLHEWLANTFGGQSMGGVTGVDMISAAVNAWGAKK
jgi:hypothetical protein